MKAALTIPQHALGRFHKLTAKNQRRVRMFLACIAAVEAAPNFSAGIADAARLGSGHRGFSPKRIESVYYAWKGTRDWTELVNWSFEKTGAKRIKPEFVEHIQRMCDRNARSIEQALKQCREAFRRGEPMPGYGTWREWARETGDGADFFPGFPPGWSTCNLRRYLDKSKFRRKVQTVGLTAAAAHRPLVYTTRKGLWVASHYFFDDLEHDFFVNSMVEKQAGRPLELFSHDLFSGRKVRYGIRVKTMRPDGKENHLAERMTRMVLAATLFLDGYSPRGTELGAEHGTAAIRERLERAIYELTGGLVTTRRSGFTGAAGHAGQYEGIRRGNPRFKASLESSNNVVHNILAGIPGQTGPDRDRRPEQLSAMLGHNAKLMAAAQVMPAAIAERIAWDILTVDQLMDVLRYYYTYLENDSDHDLEGWEECGHVVPELNLLNRWVTQADLFQLPAAEHQMAIALLGSGQLQTRPRKMSRGEVWRSQSDQLVKIPGYGVCEILGEDLSAERKIRNGMFEFEDAEVGPGVHRYPAIVTTMEGHRMELSDGETYQAFVNPFAPQSLFVRNAKGQYIGEATTVQKPCRGDYEAVKRAFGAASKTEAALLAPLRERHIEETKERDARARHNIALMSAEPSRQADLSDRADAALAAANESYANTHHHTADDDSY